MDISLNFQDVSPEVLRELLEVLEKDRQDKPLVKAPSEKTAEPEKPQVAPILVEATAEVVAKEVAAIALGIDDIRMAIVNFCKADKSNKEKIQKVFKSLGVTCLSEVNPEDYGKLQEVMNG